MSETAPPQAGYDSIVTGGPQVKLPTRNGEFVAQAWIDLTTEVEHLSVSAPGQDGSRSTIPLVRLHSECLTGDVFGSYRCDCGEQLNYALAQIHTQGGTLIYLRGHEGRGIGLANKMRAYSLQEAGADTVEANEQLGLPVDSRDYAAAAAILWSLGLQQIRLLSNNPLKSKGLAAHGITVTEVVPTQVPARAENLHYLKTKRDRMHHTLDISTENQVKGPTK